MLFDLANAARLPEKIAAMASGQHINGTENRAVMHYALRVPKDFGKPIMVDGRDVLPDIHQVLDKVYIHTLFLYHTMCNTLLF